MKAEGQNDYKKKQVYSNGFFFKTSYLKKKNKTNNPIENNILTTM